MNNLLVISGPTATGKTDFAISLAKMFNGELVNADSRQVYRGMDIGTGKDIPKNAKCKMQNEKLHIKNQHLCVGFREKDGIPIWLVDAVDPDYRFNVSEYAGQAVQVIADIQTRGKLPILVGGTGFYIKALITPPETLHIPVNEMLRKRLDTMTMEQLQKELAYLDASRLERMNESDTNNPRRLVRAIEIAQSALKKTPILDHVGAGFSRPSASDIRRHASAKTAPLQQYESLLLVLSAPLPDLYRRIDERVEERYQDGIIDEIRCLLKKGYSWSLPSFSGCGYRVWQPFFEKNAPVREILERWKRQEHAYARRQLTWFRKQPDIHWFDVTEEGYKQRIIEMVRGWYT